MATGGQKTVGYSLANVEILKLETADKSPRYISIVVCQDKIVVLDIITSEVKIHGLHDGKFLASSGSLESGPRDMCLMDAMTICVIHWDGLIEMMSIDSTDMSRDIKTTRTLHIQRVLLDYYRGVVRFKDNLVVTGVKQGKMCWCIVSLDDGHVDTIHQICKGYGSCKVTTKDTMIYISCYAGYESLNNGVYGFDILNPSQCKYKYKHQRLQIPTSIVINEDGNIFVCNNGYPDDCIHQLTASCQLVTIFTQGIPRRLQAIFWDNGCLYGTCNWSPDITVFRAVYQGSHKASEVLVSDERKQPVIEETAIQIGQGNVPVDQGQSSVATEMSPSGPVPEDSEDDKQGNASVVPMPPGGGDTDRFMRLTYLLVDVGSRILRQLLSHHTVTPTCTLDHYLAKNRSTINSLLKRKVLNQFQMDILFPPNGGNTNLEDYDVTLLSALFNNIVPSLTQQEEDMIKSLREDRNKLYGHAKSCKMNAMEYQTCWNSISSTLITLGQQCGDPNFQNEISQEIQRVQVSAIPIGSYLDILKTWFSTIETVKGSLETAEGAIQALQSRVEALESKKTAEESEDKEEGAVKPTYVDSIAEKKLRSVLSSGKDELDQRKDEIVDILFQRFNSYAFAVFLLEIKADKILEYVFSYILKTKHREALCMTLGKFQEYWRKHFHDSHLVLWVGSNYNKGDEEYTLVCYHMNDIPSEVFISHCLGLPVLYRHFQKIEREPLEIRIHQKYQHISLSNTQKCLIEKLIQIHSEELFSKHSNLEAISASSVISSKRRGLVEETSIILYCRLKGVIPFGESFFPRELRIEGQVFPTDVREGFFSFGMNGGAVNAGRPSPREYINPLKIGCSVGNYNLNCAGTLGPFVRIPNGSKGFLTCAHVFGVTSTSGSNLIVAVQPGNGEAGQQRGREARQCGVLEKVVFDSNGAVGVDAALVQIDDSRRNIDPTGFVWNHSSELERAGFSETYPPSFQHGSVLERLDFETAAHNRVIKCGRTTGLTKGSVALHGGAVRIHDATLNLPNGMTMNNQITHIMKGQYIVESNGNLPFFSDGDSGSGVYLVQRENRLALVGIAIGSLTIGECVVTPIGAVLKALSLNSDDVMMDDDMDAN